MKVKLIIHDKVHDVDGNITEVKLWKVKATPDKPHGYKYSLVYIVKGKREIGYDNAELHGNHKHLRNKVEPYSFVSVWELLMDFYRDIDRYREGLL